MSGREDESSDSDSSDVEDADEQKAITGETSANEPPHEEWPEGWVDLEREARRKLEH